MAKYLILILILINLIIPAKVLAVTKTSGDLEVDFAEPMFGSSIIWYPGLAVTRNLTVKNNGGENQTVSLEAVNKTQSGNLAQILFFQVLEGGIGRYGDAGDKSLQDFWDDGQVSLSSLGGGATTTYDLTVKMATTSGNEFQGKQAKFDLRVGFAGTLASVTSSDGGGGGGGPFAAPACFDTKPSSTPILTGAVAGANTVTLFWTAAGGPVTYYLATYGTSPGAQTYGNPNVGGPGTSSYTVSGLSGGTTYYFRIRAGNGCQPGDFSNEVAATPTGGFLTGPAEGFIPGVLAVEENIGQGEATEAGVLASTSPQPGFWRQYFWVWILVGLGGGLILARRFLKK